MWTADIGGEGASCSGGREAENIAAAKVSFQELPGGIEDQIGRPVEAGRKCGLRAVGGKLVNDPAEEIRVEQISCRIKYQTGRAIQAGGKDALGAVSREFIDSAGTGFRNKQVAVSVEGQSFGATQTGGVKSAAAIGGEAIDVATAEIGLKQIARRGVEVRKRKKIGQGGDKEEKSGERLLHIDNRVENRLPLLGYQVERLVRRNPSLARGRGSLSRAAGGVRAGLALPVFLSILGLRFV